MHESLSDHGLPVQRRDVGELTSSTMRAELQIRFPANARFAYSLASQAALVRLRREEVEKAAETVVASSVVLARSTASGRG
jgi:hypothetical protein